MALPMLNRRTSTRSSLGREAPTSSKARFPCRTTVGTIHKLYSSTSLFARPTRREDVVRHTAEEKEFDIGELRVCVLLALIIEERRCPRHRRLDDAVERDETRHDQLSH